nr:malonyl-CoA decarboxylase family protein [Tropicimonas sp. IMCC34043]
MSFLGDLLGTLYDRSRRPGNSQDRRPVEDLCDALLESTSEVAGLRLANGILSKYRHLSPEAKLGFFRYLADTLDLDAAAVVRLAEAYGADHSPANFAALMAAAEPRRRMLLRRLNQAPGATAELVRMRVDLLGLLKDHPDFATIDQDFVHMLRGWFNHGFLTMRQIDWDTSAKLLEKIVAYEAVHQIHGWDDLRRRLYPTDRRCFAFFHPSMPSEPLIFVEVALTREIPGSIQALLAEDRATLQADEARVAVFYSISNCQGGLRGVSFGNFLIKQVVNELSHDLPRLETFVTLSPMPGLTRWLRTQQGDPRAKRVLDGTATEAEAESMAARYLLEAKRPNGSPADPVARFHLGNGAIIHDVHANADTSASGLEQSCGLMVNYLYDSAQTERNHEAFSSEGKVAASRSVKARSRAERGVAFTTPPAPAEAGK